MVSALELAHADLTHTHTGDTHKRHLIICLNMDNAKEIDRTESIAEIDAGVPNKFRWDWMTLQDTNGDYYSAYIKKLNVAGFAVCKWCRDHLINYGRQGRKPSIPVQYRDASFPIISMFSDSHNNEGYFHMGGCMRVVCSIGEGGAGVGGGQEAFAVVSLSCTHTSRPTPPPYSIYM